MPPSDENEYPPQFASSDLSALLGQINDFAGAPPPPPPPPGPMELASAKSSKSVKGSTPSGNPAEELGRRLASGNYAVPVSIVGSQAQRGPYLPGLKDLLIGVATLRLAEQITTAELKSTAQKNAYDLLRAGHTALGDFIAKQRTGKK